MKFSAYLFQYTYLGLEKKIVSCNGPERNRVGRSGLFFGQKCVFYACFTLIGSWEGGKRFRVGIFQNKNWLV